MGSRDTNSIVQLGPEELAARGAAAATTWALRVDFIEDLMTSVSWTPSAGRHLAVMWGIGERAVRLLSAEASRRVLNAYREAPEEVVARLCAGLDHVVQIALGKEKSIGCKQCGSVTTHPDPDCNAAIKGQVALAQILGLAPNRHDLELKYDALDDVELLRSILRAALAAPHLRPVLLAAVRDAEGALLDGGAAEGILVPAMPMPALPARTKQAGVTAPLICACGHGVETHYLKRGCWRCSTCLQFSPKEP